MEALCDSLERLPAAFQADRAALIELLRRDGILHATDRQPILSRDGTTARWMLNSLQVTLTARGAELAARCVLELLERFDGRQIATIGFTATPILNACIQLSGGRYHGLLVRPERKPHGARKLIEGPIDPREPIIVLDDSISSGTSMQLACRHLEEAGLRVEGGIFLVRFGWYGGYARMQELGYHVEAVSDIWTDFIYHMEDEPPPVDNPSKVFPRFRWSTDAAPEGLHPAELARLTLREFAANGEAPRPPRTLDAAYPAAGGVWVSLRSTGDVHLRHARDGFWHLPGETPWSAPEGVIMAALRTAAALPPGRAGALIDDSAVAVTFFTALEACPVGGLDNDRYGIVVRGLERPGWMGGALPRMPGILNEWDQYQHARMNNAQLVSFEPHVIFRHDVIKAVEPGAAWQPSGVPAPRERPALAQAECGGAVAQRARALALARLFGDAPGAPLADTLLPPGVDSLYVSVYLDGRLRGCQGVALSRLDDDLKRLVDAALEDQRFDDGAGALARDDVAVSVAILHDGLALGPHSIDDVVRRVRHGKQALMVEQDNRSAIFLPSVASRFNLSPLAFAEALLDKAGIVAPPYRWTRYECTAWLADAGGTRLLDGSFAPEPPPEGLADLVARLMPLGVAYLLRHQRPDGTFHTRYDPFADTLETGVEIARLAHAAWLLARLAHVPAKACPALDAGWTPVRRQEHAQMKESFDTADAARRTIGFLADRLCEEADGTWIAADGHESSVAEISFLLLALCELPQKRRDDTAARLAATLWACIDSHGCVRTHRDADAATEGHQDYFPGQALLALARATRAGVCPADAGKLAAAVRYYRHRFRARPSFGQVSWLMQACRAWWQATGDRQFAALAFEIGDWILGFQQQKTGAFLNDHQSDTPGYTSALYLEGLGAGAAIARELGDAERSRRYLEACRRGLQFLDSLVIQPRDAAVLPNAARAMGGLRRSAQRSEICIDFVQHGLAAMVEIGDAARPG